MTIRIALNLILATVLRAVATAQQLDPERLSGCWKGTGTFFKADLAERVGLIDLVLEFRDGRLLKGTAGKATLGPAPVTATRNLLQLNASLTGRVAPQPEVDKDRLVLLMTAVADSTAKGEFHLKSNRVFDARVREGWVSLKRGACPATARTRIGTGY